MKKKVDKKKSVKGANSTGNKEVIAKSEKSKFQVAVEATPHVCIAYKAGLQALLKDHRSKIKLANPTGCEGSLDIDSSVVVQFPNDNRWDYCISYNSEVYFVEVHSAESSAVSVVIKKLKWLKNWLLNHAPEINRLKAGHPYYWIQSGRFAILPNSPYYRAAVQANIKPVPVLNLS